VWSRWFYRMTFSQTLKKEGYLAKGMEITYKWIADQVLNRDQKLIQD